MIASKTSELFYDMSYALALVIASDEFHARASEVYSALSGYGLAKDIVVSTTKQFERYRNVVNTVYWPAAREGRVVYERAS